jgi:predicted transcriptional regulator
MQREFDTASPADPVESIFARLQECDCRSMPVTQDGRVLGLVTAENVGEFLLVQAALRGERPGKMAERIAE